MRFYRLTESRVKRIIRHPTRVEEGVLEGAIAAMQPAGGKQYSEIWTMYVVAANSPSQGRLSSSPAAGLTSGIQPRSVRSKSDHHAHSVSSGLEKENSSLIEVLRNVVLGEKKIKVITAWRYPGKSPERDPIPSEILAEIKNLL